MNPPNSPIGPTAPLPTTPTNPIPIKPTAPTSPVKPDPIDILSGRVDGIPNIDTYVDAMNVTLFPMLLTLIASQRYIPKTKGSFADEYDYIIVGAGAAGCVVANRLSEIGCITILLLEAGKSPPIISEVPGIARGMVITDTNWGFRSVPQKYTARQLHNREIPFDAGKALGGSSNINAMVYIRGNKCDYDDWAKMGAKGWSYNEVKKYFLKLEDNTNPDIGNEDYHNVGGPVTASRVNYKPELKEPVMAGAESLGEKAVDPNGPEQLGPSRYQAFIRNGQRCSTAKAYLVPADNRTNLDIVKEAYVTKIQITNNTATGVYFKFKGKIHFVRARREVILSAGAIKTPQILMLSGIGPRETLEKFHIPVKKDLPGVGKNMQDHVTGILFFYVDDPKKLPYLLKLAHPANILEYKTKRTGPLASTSGVFHIGFHRSNDSATKEGVPNYQSYLIEGANVAVRFTFGLKPWVYHKMFHPYELKPTMWCFSSILNPNSYGEVTINSSNPYHSPLINPKFFEHPQDMIDMVAGLKYCLKLAETPEVKNAGVKPFETRMPGCEEYAEKNMTRYLECYAESFVFSIGHQSCTARMGDPNDPHSVVDPELRVIGIRGFRVIDASVMPKVMSGNTMIPTVMIAEKGSDMIKETIEC